MESMNRAPILFRCDGNPETGYEPFYQCLIAAAAMQRRRRGTHFFSNLDPLSLALPINRGGHDWNDTQTRVGTADDLDATLREIRRLNAAAVLVVAPDLNEDYLRELDASGTLVVVIDSAADLYFPNRLVLNPLLGAGRERYKHERGTQLLVGTRYAFVRPIIRRLRPLRAQEPAQPFRALVALGDDDCGGHTLTVARLLLEDERIAKLSIFVRPHHPQVTEIKEFAAGFEGRVDVATENPELSARVSRCHFAVTGGDGLALELACVGVPQLMTIVAPRHQANARYLDEEGVATDLGLATGFDPDAFRQATEILLTDPMERQGMARCGRQLIDGRGPDRFVTAVEVMLHPAPTPRLRIAA
jgi:spore coat polysaccharide biosynthesis predicted glycosyltransferase SpsG